MNETTGLLAGISTSPQTVGLTLANLLGAAKSALQEMRIERAERLLRDALGCAPGDAEAHRLLGITLQVRGRNAEAVEHLQCALASRPRDAVLHMNLGSALQEGGKPEEAVVLLQRACELAPLLAATWYNLGKALRMQVRFEPAREVLERALQLDPNHVDARVALAHTQTSLGDIAGAIVNYREVLRSTPDDAAVWFALANLKTERFGAADVAHLRKVLAQSGLDDEMRIHLGFALAKALEDQRDYPAAFDALRKANQCKRRHVAWNATAEHARIESIRNAFAQPSSVTASAELGAEVIFIACLPRTGSTLTEQILASHPQVEGANEITDLSAVLEVESKRRGQPFPEWAVTASAADWTRLGGEYLTRTQRWRQQRPRFTDKNLVTWQLVGAVMRMLPGAKVVNCRRDPLEACFSCYRQLFSSANGFSYDLDDMVEYYLDYHRLSSHWLRLFPQRVLDHEYESLLADPERQIRRLLDFCGLTFAPACLEFHRTSRTVLSTASAAQVRQPLRANTSRSSHYRRELARVRARLCAAGLLAEDC